MVTKKRLVRALLIAAILVAVAAPKIWPDAMERLSSSASGAAIATPAPATPRRDSPIRVTAEAVEPSPLAETVTSTGTLLAAESVDLQAEVNGKITAINFVEGAPVREGDLLVKLNDADLEARRVAAAYEVSLAELRERRISELLAKGFVIPADHDEALNEVNVRRAEIALTEAQIAKTEIRAPFDGIAGLRYVSEGAFVNATTRIATLQRIDTLKVDFAVPEKYADRIRLDSPIVFTVAGRAAAVRGHRIRLRSAHRYGNAHAADSCAVPESRRGAAAGRVRQCRAHARRDPGRVARACRSADPGFQYRVRVRCA